MKDVPEGGAEEDHNGAVVHGVVVDVEGEGCHTLVHQDAKVVTYFRFSILWGWEKEGRRKEKKVRDPRLNWVSIKFRGVFKHAIISFFQFSQGERSEGKRRENSRATVGGEKQKTWVKGEGWRSIITEVSAGDSEDPHGREDKDVADSEQEVGQGLEEPVVHALSLGLGVNSVLEPILTQIKIGLNQNKG